MKHTTATIAAVTVALASAQGFKPNSTPGVPKAGDIFKLVAVPKVPNGPELGAFQAISNVIVIKADYQRANCTSRTARDYASFVLSSQQQLFLFTDTPGDKRSDDNFETQQIVIDRSGMAQGQVQYTTGLTATLSRYQERGPFRINQYGDLVFYDKTGAETGFQACPLNKIDGWRVWLDTFNKPAGSEGCVGLNVKAFLDERPEACEYSVHNNNA